MSDGPPTVALGVNGSHSEGGYKDTLSNIRETGEYVVNMVTYEIRDAMNITSEMVERAVDEFKLANLTAASSNIVSVPRVLESPVNLECKLIDVISLPSNNPEQPNNMILGQVVGIHISEDIIRDGMIDMTKYHPLARLGYRDYTAVKDVFSLDRPDQAAQDKTHR